MQIQHPTASMIAKVSTAQNDETGDGSTSTVLLIGELLKQAELHVAEGLHPRVLADGFELAKAKALEVLESCKIVHEAVPHDLLVSVAHSSIATKVNKRLSKPLATICVDAVLAVQREGQIDLHMVEIMQMQHRSEEETSLVQGLVLDHGPRHPDMKKSCKNAFILTCNVSLEYEKTTVNSGFFYKTAEEREQLVAAERKFIDDRCHKIVELKKKVVGDDKDKDFVVLNQQGIDPNSLDILARNGITALRRVKRRNMERIALACGGSAMNSLDELTPDVLGWAGQVYEHTIGEEKFTFIEGVKNPKSVTVLIKASTKHSQLQIKDAVHDGLRAVKNTLEDKCAVAGAGAFEIAAYSALLKYKPEVEGKAQFGVQAFADALLVIPKTLAANAGHDPQDVIVRLVHEHATSGKPIGIDLATGEPVSPFDIGIYDNYCVKKQLLNSCTSIANNLVLVDEIMRAGLTSLKGPGPGQG